MAYPIMVILREELRGSWERKRESSLSLEASLGYKSFWRRGKTLVSSQIRRLSSPTVSSQQTRTVYSLPLHFTFSVSSSHDADADAVAMFPPSLTHPPLFLYTNNCNSDSATQHQTKQNLLRRFG